MCCHRPPPLQSGWSALHFSIIHLLEAAGAPFGGGWAADSQPQTRSPKSVHFYRHNIAFKLVFTSPGGCGAQKKRIVGDCSPFEFEFQIGQLIGIITHRGRGERVVRDGEIGRLSHTYRGESLRLVINHGLRCDGMKNGNEIRNICTQHEYCRHIPSEQAFSFCKLSCHTHMDRMRLIHKWNSGRRD